MPQNLTEQFKKVCEEVLATKALNKDLVEFWIILFPSLEESEQKKIIENFEKELNLHNKHKS